VPISDKRVKVLVESDSINPATLVDWGANKRNIQQFQNALFGIGR
jgi:hypothetical protein